MQLILPRNRNCTDVSKFATSHIATILFRAKQTYNFLHLHVKHFRRTVINLESLRPGQ